VSAPALLPLTVLLAIVTIDLWVYTDARKRRDNGRPVVVAIGSLTIDSPEAWLAGCLLLSILFTPLYLAARNDA
jgi:hypothetical protein